ncbi:MAG: hypothetical protein HY334_00265 [Armatimonadetes bacterium]|nr:hypothetical protein [Armatimonadota bacterium]
MHDRLVRAGGGERDRSLRAARNGHGHPDGHTLPAGMRRTMTMALPKTPNTVIEEWAGAIATALLDQQVWYRQALTHQEIRTLTGLSEQEVSRGCWHARLHGLLQFEPGTGQVRYTLTPLGTAIARRIRSDQAAAPDL